MEPAQRKKRILSAVVEGYIREGEPIGSKALVGETGLGVSSATVRNDLAQLTASGFLVQPHTSAGRIPTVLGYRYYVDHLMRRAPISQGGRDYIEAQLNRGEASPEDILSRSGKVISDLTGCAAAASSPPSEGSRIHRLRFVQTGSRTAMAVVIVSNGIIKTKLFRCDFLVTEQLLEVFDRAFNKIFSGMPLSSVNRPFIQTAAARLGELSMLSPGVLVAIMDACESAKDAGVYVSGEARLLLGDDTPFSGEARAIIEFLRSRHDLAEMLEHLPLDSAVSIGTENSRRELARSAVISTRYRLRGSPSGVLAAFAPIRCDYARILSIVECTAECAGELIGEIID